jgi:hypothetical protein
MAKSTLHIFARYETDDAGQTVYTIRQVGTAERVGPSFLADNDGYKRAQAYIARELAKAVKQSRRTVYPTDEIPHLWAHQALPFAKNPHGNLYFQGPTIYSYGSHFPIAVIVERNGKRAILLTNRRHSVTTNGHIRAVRAAIPPDVPVFEGPVLGDALQWARWYKSTVEDYIEQAARARANGNRPHLAGQAQAWAREAVKYGRFFGVKVDVPALPDSFDGLARRMHQERAAELARKRAQLRAVAEPIAARWRAGEVFDAWTNDRHYLQALPCMLRIKGEEVETSHGARVPVEHARVALGMVLKARANGELPWQGSFRVGYYRMERIDANGTVHIGCHKIPWAEIERLAPELVRLQPLTVAATAEVSRA